MTAMASSAWRRRVSSDGRVSQQPPPVSWQEVRLGGINGLTRDSGWIIPNAWNILCDGIIGYLDTDCDVVYSLSGPDMIRYYPSLLPDITNWYDKVRVKLDRTWPETLTMMMVPVADMRLVTIQQRASALDALVVAYERLLRTKRELGVRIAAANAEERKALIAQLNQARSRLVNELRDAANACPDIFYRIEDAAYLTQYDLLAGEQLFLHPWGVETPLDEIIEMMRFLRQLTGNG
jgi:hypothetical protein